MEAGYFGSTSTESQVLFHRVNATTLTRQGVWSNQPYSLDTSVLEKDQHNHLKGAFQKSELLWTSLNYYSDLFDHVKDCKSYWTIMKKATCYNSSTPLMAIRNPEGVLVTSDRGKADILNEHFSSTGEKLAGELQISNEDLTTYAIGITPTIMHIT